MVLGGGWNTGALHPAQVSVMCLREADVNMVVSAGTADKVRYKAPHGVTDKRR